VSEAVVSLSSVRQRVSKQEWQVREDLAAAYRLVDHYRWSDMVFTQFRRHLRRSMVNSRFISPISAATSVRSQRFRV
jgi:hypothetical protein